MIYPKDYQPRSREEHNRLVNEAVIKWQSPRQYICPDCYKPARLCHHMAEPDLLCYRHKWPGE